MKLLLLFLLMRSIGVYGSPPKVTSHIVASTRAFVPAKEVDPETQFQKTVEEIKKSGTKDTKMLRILIRMDQELAEKMAMAAIAEMEKDSDPNVQEEGKGFRRKLAVGKAVNRFGFLSKEQFESKKFDAISTKLLEAFLANAKKKKVSLEIGYGTTTVDITTSKTSPGRQLPDGEQDPAISALPKGVAAGQAFSLLEVKRKTFGFNPVVEKHPIELVLQITEGSPKRIQSDGYFHGFIDAIRGNDGTTLDIKSRENPNFKNFLTDTSRRLFTGVAGKDGLLVEYSKAVKSAADLSH